MVLRSDRIGERRLMNCGKCAEIIAYRGNDDIDVKFDNGEIKYGARYINFRRGRIRSNSKVGERRLMNCGEYATIVEYFYSHCMTVRFDSGFEKQGVTYQSFLKGAVSNINRLGERRLMKCGEYATIIEYNGYTNMVVKFDSGVIVGKVRYNRFREGLVKRGGKNVIKPYKA